MAERPILFSGPMVRAYLAGYKTQARRPIKPQPLREGSTWFWRNCGWQYDHGPLSDMLMESFLAHSPYGQHGDILWVREAWQLTDGCGPWRGPIPDACPAGYWIDYAATDEGGPHGWRPSIHMPRWASRIQLRVKSVRVERALDITENDAIAEGMDIFEDGAGYTIPLGNGKLSSWMRHPEECFSALWDMTYTKRGYGWDANPWAWVIEFEKI